MRLPLYALLVGETDASGRAREEGRVLWVAVYGEATGDLRAQLNEVLPKPQPDVLAAVGVGLDARPKPLVCFVQSLRDRVQGAERTVQQGPVLCSRFSKSRKENIPKKCICSLSKYLRRLRTHQGQGTTANVSRGNTVAETGPKARGGWAGLPGKVGNAPGSPVEACRGYHMWAHFRGPLAALGGPAQDPSRVWGPDARAPGHRDPSRHRLRRQEERGAEGELILACSELGRVQRCLGLPGCSHRAGRRLLGGGGCVERKGPRALTERRICPPPPQETWKEACAQGAPREAPLPRRAPC